MNLPQNQNLIVWFRCQLCRGSFPTVNEFIEHKVQWHLIEFQKINSDCILFEEFTANKKEPADETPATTTVRSSDANLQSQTEIQAGPGSEPEPEKEKEVVHRHDASKRVQGQAFPQAINPLVLITRLTLKEIQAASQKSISSLNKPKLARSSIRRKKSKTTITKSKSFQCLKAGCSETFRTLRSRNVHFAMHGKSTSNGRQQDRPFHCSHPGCGKSFKRKDGLKSHLETHRGPRDRRTFPCQICSRGCYRKDYLDKHYREVHGNARQFLCPQPDCMKSFKRKEAVTNHLETHADPRDRRTFPCQICSRICLKKGYLDKHYREVHGKNLPFTCPHPGCTKSFKRKVAVRDHSKTHVDPNDRPLFACKICLLPYWHLDSLKKHCLVAHGVDASTGQA